MRDRLKRPRRDRAILYFNGNARDEGGNDKKQTQKKPYPTRIIRCSCLIRGRSEKSGNFPPTLTGVGKSIAVRKHACAEITRIAF